MVGHGYPVCMRPDAKPRRTEEEQDVPFRRSADAAGSGQGRENTSYESIPQSCRTRELYRSSHLTIADVVCAAPRSGCGPERAASGSHVMLMRSGMFVRHGGRVSGRGITANPGTALFFNADEPFRVSHPTSRGDTSTTIAFATDIVSHAFRHKAGAGQEAQYPYPLTHVVLAPALLLDLYRLRRRLRAKVPAQSIEIEERALALLERIVADSFSIRDTLRKRDYESGSVRRRDIAEAVKEALAKNPFVATSLGDLATYLDISPFHLARTFSAEVGVPIHQYLLRLRLAAALERVSDPSANLAAIALDVGFCSPSHFSTAFRKAFGTAPTSLRVEDCSSPCSAA
jgi:AraC family transcriptional regulator